MEKTEYNLTHVNYMNFILKFQEHLRYGEYMGGSINDARERHNGGLSNKQGHKNNKD